MTTTDKGFTAQEVFGWLKHRRYWDEVESYGQHTRIPDEELMHYASAAVFLAEQTGENAKKLAAEWAFGKGSDKYDDVRRHLHRLPDFGVVEELGEGVEDPMFAEIEAETSPRVKQLRHAWGVLSPFEKKLMWYCAVEELPYRIISQRLKKSEGALRVAFLRTRRKLQEACAA